MSGVPSETRARFVRLWATRRRCANGHDLSVVGVAERWKRFKGSGTYRVRECPECVREQKARAYRREMADPIKVERRRAIARRASAAYRARRKEESQ